MFRVIWFAGLLTAVTWTAKEPHSATHWGYPYDADIWGKEESGGNAVCKEGHSQSPIDLKTTQNRQAANISLNWKTSPWLTPYGGASVRGHGIGFKVHPTAGSLMVGKKEYTLLQMHIHTGSEHTVNGRQFAAEIHFVHSISGEEPDLVNGDLAVVGLFFELWDGKNDTPDSVTAMDELLSYIPFTEDSSENWNALPSKVMRAWNVGRFNTGLTDMTAFWTYDGSLTTPPCSEIVAWHVMMQPLKISPEQVDRIQRIYGWHDNFRPPMELNGRTVSPNDAESNGKLCTKEYYTRCALCPLHWSHSCSGGYYPAGKRRCGLLRCSIRCIRPAIDKGCGCDQKCSQIPPTVGHHVHEFENTAECPSGYHGLTEQQCRIYAENTKGRKWDWFENFSIYPSGCFTNSWSGSVKFNRSTTGRASSYRPLICAEGTD